MFTIVVADRPPLWSREKKKLVFALAIASRDKFNSLPSICAVVYNVLLFVSRQIEYQLWCIGTPNRDKDILLLELVLLWLFEQFVTLLTSTDKWEIISQVSSNKLEQKYAHYVFSCAGRRFRKL